MICIGGGNSNIFGFFYPENWGKKYPTWRAYFVKSVETTNMISYFLAIFKDDFFKHTHTLWSHCLPEVDMSHSPQFIPPISSMPRGDWSELGLTANHCSLRSAFKNALCDFHIPERQKALTHCWMLFNFIKWLAFDSVWWHPFFKGSQDTVCKSCNFILQRFLALAASNYIWCESTGQWIKEVKDITAWYVKCRFASITFCQRIPSIVPEFLNERTSRMYRTCDKNWNTTLPEEFCFCIQVLWICAGKIGCQVFSKCDEIEKVIFKSMHSANGQHDM